MLKLKDTLTKQLREFVPLTAGQASIYQCGPTVYWRQHAGNLRAAVMGDLVRRTVSYFGHQVLFVRNITDVGHLESDGDSGEDKMAKGAKREGKTPQQIALHYTHLFHTDIAALNVMPPAHEPAATQYIAEMIDMVQVLLDKGFAYATPEAIYFDISKAKDYTRLSGQNLEANIVNAGHGGVDQAETHKRQPQDFALWFFKTGAHKNALQTWSSPFSSPEVEEGEGFPGWHIECSAMATKLLGSTIDIHLGGVEHIPVHHTNEIAQSESATNAQFANYWLHYEHLMVDGEKMSKSLGNVLTLDDVVEKGYDPLALRYFFLQAHYRSKQNFTWEALQGAATAYTRLQQVVKELFVNLEPGSQPLPSAASAEFKQKLDVALAEDVNIPQALAVVWEVVKADLPSETKLATLLDFDQVLGLQLEKVENPHQAEIPAAAQELLEKRAQAREAKDWKQADALRDQLQTEFGLTVKDTAEGQMVS